MIETINALPEAELCGIALVFGLLIAGCLAVDIRGMKK